MDDILNIDKNTVIVPYWCKQAVERLSEIKGDDEAAHGFEDDVMILFLSHLAKNRVSQITACARILVTMKDVEFQRWCA